MDVSVASVMSQDELNAAWDLIADLVEVSAEDIARGSRTWQMVRYDYVTGESTVVRSQDVPLLPVPLSPEEVLTRLEALEADCNTLEGCGFDAIEPEDLRDQAFPALRAYFVVFLGRFGFDIAEPYAVALPEHALTAVERLVELDDTLALIELLRDTPPSERDANEDILDLLEDIQDHRLDAEEAMTHSLRQLVTNPPPAP
jgi:hypothetical protein